MEKHRLLKGKFRCVLSTPYISWVSLGVNFSTLKSPKSWNQSHWIHDFWKAFIQAHPSPSRPVVTLLQLWSYWFPTGKLYRPWRWGGGHRNAVGWHPDKKNGARMYRTHREQWDKRRFSSINAAESMVNLLVCNPRIPKCESCVQYTPTICVFIGTSCIYI